jgi:hypothetical protein
VETRHPKITQCLICECVAPPSLIWWYPCCCYGRIMVAVTKHITPLLQLMWLLVFIIFRNLKIWNTSPWCTWFHAVHYNWMSHVSEQSQHNFIGQCLYLKFVSHYRNQKLPSYGLPVGVKLIIVNSSFITTSHIILRKFLSFILLVVYQFYVGFHCSFFLLLCHYSSTHCEKLLFFLMRLSINNTVYSTFTNVVTYSLPKLKYWTVSDIVWNYCMCISIFWYCD